MNDPFRRPPRFGTTDWAAQKIRAMLNEEDRRRTRRSSGSNSRTEQARAVHPATAASSEVRSDMSVYPQSQTHPYPPPYLTLRQTPESRQGLIDSIIAEEGGYTDDPTDRGGPTNFGITQRTIDDYKNRIDSSFNQTPAGLSRDEAVQIYDGLIKEYRLDRIADPNLRAQVIDIMVNSGIDSAGKMLLDVLEHRGYDVRTGPSDNVIGSRTHAILRDLVNQRADKELTEVNNDLVNRRRAFLFNLLRNDPSQEGRRDGWLNRADAFRVLPTGRQR
jgi:lysozyme family protein